MSIRFFRAIGLVFMSLGSAVSSVRADPCVDLKRSTSGHIATMIQKLEAVVNHPPIDEALACHLEKDLSDMLRNYAQRQQAMHCPDAPNELPSRPTLPTACAKFGVHF